MPACFARRSFLSGLLGALAFGLTACSSSSSSPLVIGGVDAAPDAGSAVDSGTLVEASPLTDAAKPWVCDRPGRAVVTPSQCNGSATLCDKRFDQVSIA